MVDLTISRFVPIVGLLVPLPLKKLVLFGPIEGNGVANVVSLDTPAEYEGNDLVAAGVAKEMGGSSCTKSS